MNIHLYQVVVIGIATVMLYTGVKNFVRRETGQTWIKLFIRLLVWGGMVVVAVYPGATTYFAKMIGMVDNMNAVIMTGFLLVFLLIFKLLSAIEKIEQNVSELTRKEALNEARERIDQVGSNNESLNN